MKKLVVVVVIFFMLRLTRAEKPQYEWDENGYVLYCPCMGECSAGGPCISVWEFLCNYICIIIIICYLIGQISSNCDTCVLSLFIVAEVHP